MTRIIREIQTRARYEFCALFHKYNCSCEWNAMLIGGLLPLTGVWLDPYGNLSNWYE